MRTVFLYAFIGLFGFLSYRITLFLTRSPAQLNGIQKSVYYELKAGKSPQVVAKDLEKLGIIQNSFFFYWYMRLTHQGPLLKSADYRLTTSMKPQQVLNMLMSGVSYGFPLTIPEGYNLWQLRDHLNRMQVGFGDEFFKLCFDKKWVQSIGLDKGVDSVEGYLFPDTYIIQRRTKPAELLQLMLTRFQEVAKSLWVDIDPAFSLSQYQWVTLASIIEKETGASHERQLISSVFHNRLKKKMRLQTDPTVIYGILRAQNAFDGNITKKDLMKKNPYNTYLISGLPPGPIANPGKQALFAALNPYHSQYLYFVSKNDGTHFFSETYEEHLQRVQEFQMRPEAREGKSWRQLQPQPPANGG